MLYSKRIVLTIVLLCTALEMISQSPRFSFSEDVIVLANQGNVHKELFKVYRGTYTSASEVGNKKSILGSFSQNDTEIRFTPLLPFQKESDYTILFNNDVHPFKITIEASYSRLEVQELYPNTDTIPSNFLKWYIRFSRPVNPSNIFEHIYLIDNSDGTKVNRALLPLESPLLNDDGTLLTLWIEPGRQKRDLGPNRELGEVLISGRSYTLVIDKHLKDREGVAMGSAYTHSFYTNSADRIQPSITSWEFKKPHLNTLDTLSIHLKEFLDYGSVINSLKMEDASGETIEGKFDVDTNQKYITFIPLEKWKQQTYILRCKPYIEDLSGNNLERLFDRDITVERVDPVLELSFILE